MDKMFNGLNIVGNDQNNVPINHHIWSVISSWKFEVFAIFSELIPKVYSNRGTAVQEKLLVSSNEFPYWNKSMAIIGSMFC